MNLNSITYAGSGVEYRKQQDEFLLMAETVGST